MFTRSIRWRLLVWLAFLLICLLGAFGITAFQLNRTNRLSEIDDELAQCVARVSEDVRGRLPFGRPLGPPPPGMEGPPWSPDQRQGERPADRHFKKGPGPGGPMRRPLPSWIEFQEMLRNIRLSPETQSLFNEADKDAFYYSVWAPDGTLLKRSTNAPPEVSVPASPGPDTSIQTRSRESYREAYHFTEMGECILAGRSIVADVKALNRFAWLLVGAGAAVLALGLGGGWFMVSGALKPIENIAGAATRISLGNLSERISEADTDSELGRLANVLNSTFARLESAFAQQKQFTADASHELRTPLAVMISEAQTALSRPRTPAEYQETVQVCLDTAQQMRRLTQSLMTLARFDAGQEPGQRIPVDLAERAQHCAELVETLAAQKGITIERHLRPARITGDPDQIDQVLMNLLSNAVQFNRQGGRIRLSTSVHDGVPALAVADTGPGISAEDLPHVFERFYRGDKVRSREEGHAGLGLAICKSIVESHGGTITAANQPQGGAVFTVSFPGVSAAAQPAA